MYSATIRRFFKKKKNCSEEGQDPELSKDLEMRMKTPRGTPKNTIQCKNPPNSELWVARDSCGAKAPCCRAPNGVPVTQKIYRETR